MDMSVFLFKYNFAKIKIVISTVFSKKGIAIMPFALSMPLLLSDTQKAIVALIGLMIFDFVTGIGASYFKKKKYEKENPNQPKQKLISSDKLKGSGVKFLLYTMTIIASYFLQIIFKLKTFSLPISDIEFSLTLGVILFWCLVECYSIFFENFKEMGIDIKTIIRKIVNLKKFLSEKSKEMCEKEN